MAYAESKHLFPAIIAVLCLATVSAELVVPHPFWLGLSSLLYYHCDRKLRRARADEGGTGSRDRSGETVVRFLSMARWLLIAGFLVTCVRLLIRMM